MNKAAYEKRAEALLLPIVEEKSFELVDVEFVKEGGTWYLRAYIDKPGGITIDDCELVSKAFEEELDREDFITESYVLEVSSPGLGRPLKKEKDYVRNQGKDVEVHTFKAYEHEKSFEGVLKSWDAGTVTVTLDDEKDITFDRADIALIREALDW